MSWIHARGLLIKWDFAINRFVGANFIFWTFLILIVAFRLQNRIWRVEHSATTSQNFERALEDCLNPYKTKAACARDSRDW